KPSLSEKLGREPTLQEMAKALKVPIKKATHIRLAELVYKPVDMHGSKKNEETSPFVQLFSTSHPPIPEEEALTSDDKEIVRGLLETLPDREKRIISLRFGLGVDSTSFTLKEIGEIEGLTRERVRQIIA